MPSDGFWQSKRLHRKIECNYDGLQGLAVFLKRTQNMLPIYQLIIILQIHVLT